jgi:phage baseplate assembly protein V
MTKELEQLQRQITAMQRRVQSTATRGVVTLVSDKEKTQRFQVELLADETEDDVEHFQPMGWSWATEPGAESVCIAIGGDRAHTIALCANDPSKRPKSAKPGTGGCYKDGKWVMFVDTSSVVHIGAEAGAEFIAQAQKTQDQFDKLRKRIDDLTTAFNSLTQNFTSFVVHTHPVATAGTAVAQTGTAAPYPSPPPPVGPISPPLGAATTVAATKGKVT